MRRKRLTLAATALLAASCTTAPPPRPAPPPSIVQHPPVVLDLEEARRQIETRVATPSPAKADVEAVASIPLPSHASIGKAINLFAGRLKPSVQESLTRSAQYRELIDRVLDEYKLPRALAYLPVIESAYLPTLTSRAGARGIWQFMTETAREYGLRVDWWVDERADPERSTRAAAAFIKDLYRQFDDWPLTLAAYNAGAGRVKRALNASGSTTFWELSERSALPAETRGYVPTFFATILIAGDPVTYGFQLTDPMPADMKRIAVDGPVSLRYIARITNVDEVLLGQLNPSFRRGIVPPGMTAINVPAAAAPELAARARTLKHEDDAIAICTFTLREGDSIRRLANAIGSDADTLLSMNSYRSARAGETVYLPVRARELGALLAGEQYYAVKQGDTIYSIAKRFDLTTDELRDLNQLRRNHKIRTGDKLRVSAPRALTAGGM
jgi:membrane-bound lytic murein transglycosylase D